MHTHCIFYLNVWLSITLIPSSECNGGRAVRIDEDAMCFALFQFSSSLFDVQIRHGAKGAGSEVTSGGMLLNEYVELTPYTPFYSHTPSDILTLHSCVIISLQCVVQRL